LIEALARVKDSFNSYPLGRPAQAGAVAALEDETHFQRSRAMVIEERDRLTRGLTRLGFDVLPSAANFVFARHPARDGAELTADLRAQEKGGRTSMRVSTEGRERLRLGGYQASDFIH
jgi:histidinol-phosphate aminotransferase